MLSTAVVLFLVSAIFGVIMLRAVLANSKPPRTPVYVHGLLNVIGLVMVLIAAFGGRNSAPSVTGAAATQPESSPILAVILLVVAALGGLTLFAMDMQNKKLPRPLAVIHPIIGVLGVLALIVYIVNT